VFYIFHGEDEFSRSEELARLRAKLAEGDRAMADLNTTVLDGNKVTMGELRHACDAIPFLSERRLVIVHGLLSRLGGGRKGGSSQDAYLKELAAYLPQLPPTTRLIFVEERTLPPSHPILKVAKEERKRRKGFVREFNLPREDALPRWIRQRVEEQGGRVSSEAVALLAALVGNDLRQLDQEIEKLLLYADGRQITSRDVRLLVGRARETSIFDLVDQVSRRRTDVALRLLHRLLDEGESPLYLLAMLARQIRILIQIAELQEQGMNRREIAARLNLHPFVVKKGLNQARNFSMAQLEAAHERLVETDWAIKTGEMEDVLALEMLIVNLTAAP